MLRLILFNPCSTDQTPVDLLPPLSNTPQHRRYLQQVCDCYRRLTAADPDLTDCLVIERCCHEGARTPQT